MKCGRKRLPKIPMKKEEITQYWRDKDFCSRTMAEIATAAIHAPIVRNARILFKMLGLLNCCLFRILTF